MTGVFALAPARARHITIGVFAVWLLLSLAGCASHALLPHALPELSLPRMALVTRLDTAPPDTGLPSPALLALQAEGAGLRWSLFTPLGAPIARQILEHGAWRNDGFVAPNAAARALFAAVLFAWTPTPALSALYPTAEHDDSGEHHLPSASGTRLSAYTQGDQTDLELADGSRWRVSVLPAQEPSQP